MNLSLAVIAKDQVEEVKRIIDSYCKYFSEICIAGDSRHEEFEALTGEYGGCYVKYFRYEWIKDFAHKRNFLAEKVLNQYYMRIDTDDIILNPDNIEAVLDKCLAQNIDVVYTPYNYSRDEDGNINGFHYRETIIKKSPNCYWKKPVHENVFVENQNIFKGVRDNSIQIEHVTDDGHVERSNKRNLEILLDEYKRDGENTDPRTISYIGRVLLGMGIYKEAVHFLRILVAKTGWDDDRYFALVQLAEAYSRLGKPNEAIDSALLALKNNPRFPDAYLKLGQIHLDAKNFTEALEWYKAGIVKPKPDTMYVVDPTVYGYVSFVNMGLCYLGTGDWERGYACYEKAREQAPTNKSLLEIGKQFEEAKINGEAVKAYKKIEEILKKKSPQMLENIPKIIPSILLQDERFASLRLKYLHPIAWANNSIVIYCGGAYEDWADPSVSLGIGGSEEAVVYVSRELTKLGYDVTVYNQCGTFAGEYKGVKYRPYFEFNPRDKFNILIAWRGNIFGNIEAKKKFIWLHDVPNEQMFPESSINSFDKIFVLSEFHKSLLPKYIPEDKIYVTSNGINLADIKDSVDRKPYKCIWTSSYDRGLEHLLRMWSEVRKEVPAELHIFYGWNTYDEMVKMGMRDPSFKEQMVELMNQPGVFEHGRVGQKQLAKELQSSEFFLYPSHFEEISCISAMRAQACGAVPITTNYAALSETVKNGIVIEGKAGSEEVNKKYFDKLVHSLKNRESKDISDLRNKMIVEKQRFGWDKVARNWDTEQFEKLSLDADGCIKN